MLIPAKNAGGLMEIGGFEAAPSLLHAQAPRKPWQDCIKELRCASTLLGMRWAARGLVEYGVGAKQPTDHRGFDGPEMPS